MISLIPGLKKCLFSVSAYSLEGPEGVNWELGFAPFQGWELGFNALGLGFFHWEWDKFFGIGNEYSLFCPVSIQLNGPIMLEIYYVKNRINLCH